MDSAKFELEQLKLGSSNFWMEEKTKLVGLDHLSFYQCNLRSEAEMIYTCQQGSGFIMILGFNSILPQFGCYQLAMWDLCTMVMFWGSPLFK